MKDPLKNALKNLTGPLGPFVTIEQGLKETREWLDSLQLRDLEALKAVLLDEQLEDSEIDVNEGHSLAVDGLARIADSHGPNAILHVATR